ncbi:MAG: hypothetical protein M3O07_01760, partial [Pseudomonadota bacterium]|nr:hypothetical protein [Pseudomonadota bacterium]
WLVKNIVFDGPQESADVLKHAFTGNSGSVLSGTGNYGITYQFGTRILGTPHNAEFNHRFHQSLPILTRR